MQINNNFQKNANISMVAQLLWKNPGMSRVEISRHLDLYRSTVSNIINTLIQNKIVFEDKEGESLPQGGRKPIFLQLNESFGYVLGIEVHPSGMYGAVVNVNGEILMSLVDKFDADQIFENITSFIDTILTHSCLETNPLLGICIAFPGIVDTIQGIVLNSEPFNLKNINIKDVFSKKYGVPVFVENDAKCLAWLELANNREQGIENFVCLSALHYAKNQNDSKQSGLGIGFSLAVNGGVYSGTRYAAGEFKSCSWLGSKTSQTGLSEIILADLETNDNSFSIWVEDIFKSLISIISVFDPEALFLHGEFFKRLNCVEKTLSTSMPQFTKLLEEIGCQMHYRKSNDFTIATGAALMFFMHLFSFPASVSHNKNTVIEWDTMFEIINRKIS